MSRTNQEHLKKPRDPADIFLNSHWAEAFGLQPGSDFIWRRVVGDAEARQAAAARRRRKLLLGAATQSQPVHQLVLHLLHVGFPPCKRPGAFSVVSELKSEMSPKTQNASRCINSRSSIQLLNRQEPGRHVQKSQLGSEPGLSLSSESADHSTIEFLNMLVCIQTHGRRVSARSAPSWRRRRPPHWRRCCCGGCGC